jgi:hypothetical protein
MSRYLFLAGGLVLLLLGTIHVVLTPQHTGERKGLSPVEPAVAESMARARVRLSDRMDMWRAWVGFNLSHSLGVSLLGLTVLLVGRTPASFAYNAAVFQPLAVVVSLAYLGLAVVYWFRGPVIGVGLSVALFACAWTLSLVGRT